MPWTDLAELAWLELGFRQSLHRWFVQLRYLSLGKPFVSLALIILRSGVLPFFLDGLKLCFNWCDEDARAWCLGEKCLGESLWCDAVVAWVDDFARAIFVRRIMKPRDGWINQLLSRYSGHFFSQHDRSKHSWYHELLHFALFSTYMLVSTYSVCLLVIAQSGTKTDQYLELLSQALKVRMSLTKL